MKMMHLILACALIHTTLFNFVDKVNYTFQHDPIDAVIPCHWKDAHKLDAVINSIKKNVHNIRRIIIVSSKQFSEKAEWFDERQYPFNQKTIALEIFDGNEKKAQEFLDKPRTRVHWIYQQLLKLYAPLVIPEISSNVLLVDSDTLFLRPITFTNPKTGAGLLACATEYHRPYFEHAARLIPGFKRLYNCSGIVHHMLLQRPILNDLFMIIEQEHNMEPWKALCKCINHNQLPYSCMSEYETYFNFALTRSNNVKIRKLKYKSTEANTFKELKKRKPDLDFVSCHTYIS